MPLPAHTAVGTSSVLPLPELWSSSHCMTRQLVCCRAGVGLALGSLQSRVHVPHLVPLHPLSLSKQILPLHLIKSDGAEQEPNTNVSRETGKLSVARGIQGLQSSPAGSVLWQPLQRSHSVIIAAGIKSNQMLALILCWFVLLLVCSAQPSVHTSAPSLSKGLFLPWLPSRSCPPKPPAHCCAAAPGPALHYVRICPCWFLTKKAS